MQHKIPTPIPNIFVLVLMLVDSIRFILNSIISIIINNAKYRHGKYKKRLDLIR